VFQLLKRKNQGENITIMKNEVKIFEITKQYNKTGFPDDELSLGYSIDVFQESINKTFREYLVNFDFMVRVLENYGFVLVKKEEAQKMNLPNGSGLFGELFSMMEHDIKRFPYLKADYGESMYMTSEERTISFLNRYFVFQKIRDVKNTEKIAKISLEEEKDERKEIQDIEDEFDIMRFDQGKVEKAEKPGKTGKSKTSRKMEKQKYKLDEYSPIVESPEKEELPEKEKEKEVPEKQKVVFGKDVVLIKRKPKKITLIE
jgi:hypothetical protein